MESISKGNVKFLLDEIKYLQLDVNFQQIIRVPIF